MHRFISSNSTPVNRKCYDDTFDENRNGYNNDGTLKSIEDLELWRKRLFRIIKEATEDDSSSLFVEKKQRFYDGLKAYISARRLADGKEESVVSKRNVEWLEREARELGEGYSTFQSLHCNESIEGKENAIPSPKRSRTPQEWEDKQTASI